MKKILKNSLWNQIFHSKQLRQQRNQYWRYKALVLNSPKIFQLIEEAENLDKLLSVHKKVWFYGFRNENLGPSQFGMFRTKDILQMTQDEVYLGGIHGLWTFTIKEWNKHVDDEAYNIILNQYRNLLKSNVEFIKKQANEYITQMQNMWRGSF